MTTPTFVHLRLHTEYSMANGMVRIKPLVKACVALGMPAVAVTDQNNLFAMVKFYKEAVSAGIKPIIGVDLQVVPAAIDNPFQPRPRATRTTRLALLCRNRTGYLNLSRLISRAYTDPSRTDEVVIDRAWLDEPGATEGLIALSSGRQGEVGEALLAGQIDEAKRCAKEWQQRFAGDFYLEVQRTGRVGDEHHLHAAVELASELSLPVVATNDVHFLEREEFDAHEVRVSIHDSRTLDDPRRERRYSEEQYLKSPEEMAELFSDLPEALENSVEIARRCSIELELGSYYLPEYPVPDGMTVDSFFRQLSRDGLQDRLIHLFDPASERFEEQRKRYDERLEIELDVIIQMGFPGYFLIVADFIRWARENGVPVGPGRGSGAGSLVAYALGITNLDPLAYDLLFERFLNPERVSMPDFDIDFCMEGRDRVIDYVADRYGRNQVSQIITYGSLAAKAVVRDVGRVLGHPYGFVDRIAKLIPMDIGMTLTKALEQEEDLKDLHENDEDVRDLINMALKLEGLTRNAGKHAGGVVISPTDLTDFSPLFCEPGGQNRVTQFDKKDVELVGLVKFDFLGLRTLTIIDWALDNIRRRLKLEGRDPAECPGIDDIPLDDQLSFTNLKKGNTTAVFQLESDGMKKLIKRLQPDCFEDIVALVALFRPGPLQSGMVENFINRKHGREKISYPDPQYQHESLQPILEPTYGVILYQEQVMQIAQVLAGYSLGGADLLRRAMGKKMPEEMAKQRAGFEDGAKSRGIDGNLAMKIFDLVEKFAGYGFNKSHSAAYALVSYQTLWLKTHYPAEFMAAVLSADMDRTDKVVGLIDECHAMGLKVVPPSVNSSLHRFSVSSEGSILYGLGAIKGVGESAIEGIVEEVARYGSFSNLFDFCSRIDLRRCNRRVLESLIHAGALDEIGPNRATLFYNLDQAIRSAEQQQRNRDSGMGDLFGLPGDGDSDQEGGYLEVIDEWVDSERLQHEKSTLGLYLTGHPIVPYLQELGHFTSGRIADVCASLPVPRQSDTGEEEEGGSWSSRRAQERQVVVAGLAIAVRLVNAKRGRMSIVTLDDRSGRLDAVIPPDRFDRYRALITLDQLVIVEGRIGFDDYSGGFRITVDRLFTLEQAREQFVKAIRLSLQGDRLAPHPGRAIADLLKPYLGGRCPLQIDYRNSKASVRLEPDREWLVRPQEELIGRLGEWAGEGRVELVY